MIDAARLSDVELDALTKRLAARPLPPERLRASVVDIATHRRQPLGLRPILEADDDEDDRASRSHAPPASARTPAPGVPAMHDDLMMAFDAIGAVVAAMNEGRDRAEAKAAETHGVIRELQVERERDRASLAEMRSKIAELDFVVSRLKVENAGPIGPPGPRGVDGRDGARGPRGERGRHGAGRAEAGLI